MSVSCICDFFFRPFGAQRVNYCKAVGSGFNTDTIKLVSVLFYSGVLWLCVLFHILFLSSFSSAHCITERGLVLRVILG